MTETGRQRISVQVTKLAQLLSAIYGLSTTHQATNFSVKFLLQLACILLY